MNKLEELNAEYLKNRNSGGNQYSSAKQAVNKVFIDYPVKPHIYQDINEDASHLFFENQVLIFDSGIYNKNQ